MGRFVGYLGNFSRALFPLIVLILTAVLYCINPSAVPSAKTALSNTTDAPMPAPLFNLIAPCRSGTCGILFYDLLLYRWLSSSGFLFNLMTLGGPHLLPSWLTAWWLILTSQMSGAKTGPNCPGQKQPQSTITVSARTCQDLF